MAVGRGRAVAYRSGRWQTSQKIDSNAGINTGLATVSCVSSNLCLAGDGRGNAFLYNGKSWSAPSSVAPSGFSQISCATRKFCGAVYINGGALFFNGSSWSKPSQIPGTSQPLWISCRRGGFCMALDGAGTSASRRVAGRWVSSGSLNTTNPVGGSEPNVASAVSCSGPKFCAALDNFGEAFTWAGKRWSRPVRFDANLLDGFDAVSCTSKTACVAVDGNGLTTRWNGRGWSRSQQIDKGGFLMSVSCASANFCVAVDGRGRAVTYR